MLFRLSLAALAVSLVSADTPDNVSSRLMVHIPHRLFKEQGYDHREALFGIPPYGGSIAQNLYYADSTLCNPDHDATTQGYATRPLDPDTGKMEEWPAPYILMVDRGSCTFVKKVRNAQRLGAAAVIIADNTCLCSDTACIEASGVPTCETTEPIMADDGSGADISIPSFLMFKHDADQVKVEVEANRPVQLEMAWALPSPDDRVEYDLWTVPTDVVSVDFLSRFKYLAESLGERAYFTPHMYIYDGIKSHCQGNDGENFCYNLCTNNGRYCATDPDNDLDKGISGADVVKESLRRLCIWNHYGAVDGVGSKWWDYVAIFLERCNSPDYFMNQDCVDDAYRHADIDKDKVERCMQDSGGLERDNANAFLDNEIAAQTQRGVVIVPTAFVNNAAIRGALTPGNIFSAICAGYLSGTTPGVCAMCASCAEPEECLKSGGMCMNRNVLIPTSSGGVSTHTFTFTMLFVISVFTGLGIWHYKKTKEEMRDQVRGILAEYMPLEDQEQQGGAYSNPMNFAMQGGKTSLIS